MPLEALTISELSDDILSKAISTGPAGVFYHRELLDLWTNTYGWKGITLTDGSTLFVGFEKSTLLGRMFYSLPFGWYGGVVDKKVDVKFAGNVDKWLSKQKYIQTNIVQFAPEAAGSPFPALQSRELTTHILDLTREANFSENTIRNIRKAQVNGLLIDALKAQHRDQFVALQREHVSRTGEKRKLPEQFYQLLFNISLKQRDQVSFVGVFSKERLLAAQIYFTTPTDIFYFDGFSCQAGLDHSANFVLFDQVICFAREGGKLRLNFGASPEGDSGLVRFKEGWGATPVVYHEYSRRVLRKLIADKLTGRS